MSSKTLFLAFPRGFCAGVNRAILTVEKALKKFGTPLYVNHEIVHNQFVVNNFKRQGVIFTDNLEEIPSHSIYIFSAHGVSPQFRIKAEEKKLKIIDATCPLVTKVHWEAQKFAEERQKIFYIGQKDHQEFLGVKGIGNIELLENLESVEKLKSQNFKNTRVVCLSQTTLSVDDTQSILKALKQKIPHVRTPEDICYATTNRQKAVKNLAEICDFIAVIGSKNSSNSNKLVTTAQQLGCPSQLFENAESINDQIFQYEKIGLTSGASVPEILVENIIQIFKIKQDHLKIEEIKIFDETVTFPLPQI
ncbi:4-hydroxy-3-methylbut-2-enyl diphosphate reductase [Candidatus Gracilibacteria bacterium]|nr:4-hydroxy-3-methylbut-2-enyl diphosphate reductase [Candidatus Gracilibacteria bacterium]